MNKLIIICGLPAVGKTTVADELSRKLKIFCLHKDTLKESLYNSLEMKTLEDSKKIGWPSVKGILDLAEENLKLGSDVILESTFNFSEDAHIFKRWKKELKIKIYTIILETNEKERELRFKNRERNKAHHDYERNYVEIRCSFKHMVGNKLLISTEETTEKIIKEIIKFISRHENKDK